MIQNSLSPVVKSRISSFSGNTISVEKRSFARTGTMSSFEYFTTRAPSAAATKGVCPMATKQKAASVYIRIRVERRRGRCFMDQLLTRARFPVLTGENLENEMHRENERGSDCCKRKRQECVKGIHGLPPARISKPFSNPYFSNASFR